MVSYKTELEPNKVFSIKGKAMMLTSKLADETNHSLTLNCKRSVTGEKNTSRGLHLVQQYSASIG